VIPMQDNFHESYARGEIKPPSARSTGLLFAAIAGIIAALWRESLTVVLLALGMATLLTAISLMVPSESDREQLQRAEKTETRT
jgi:hypothetical protein